jgi:hypothetical protein
MFGLCAVANNEGAVMNFWAATIVTAILAAIYATTIVNFALDIVFYARNGFDFTIDSGRRLTFGGAGRIPGMVKAMSNKSRVLFAYPFKVIVYGLLLRHLALEWMNFFG